MRRQLCTAAILLTAALSSTAQYYPSPNPQPRPQSGRQAGGAKDKSEDDLLATFTGTLKGIDKKSLLLEEDAGNEIPMHLTRKTSIRDGDKKLGPSDLKSGTPLAIEAKRFPDGSLDAINVRVEHPKRPKPEDQ